MFCVDNIQRARKLAVGLGFGKMHVKEWTLRCFFECNPDSPYFQSETFSRLLVYLQTHTNKAKLKQVVKNGIMIVEKIKIMTELLEFCSGHIRL